MPALPVESQKGRTLTNVAVAVIGVLSLLNLALTFALMKYVRRHGARPAGRAPAVGRPLTGLPTGGPAPEFTGTAVSGEAVSLGDLTGARSVVAFLGANCPPCRIQLPEFRDYARSVPGGAAQVLAVVMGPENLAAEYAEELSGTATVVLEPPGGGPVVQAFSVSAYPTFYVLDEQGRVESAGAAIRHLTTPTPA
jgi:peroxiredoxin